ncbi:MAG TPA: response regulator [Chromatiales bacterium]|nr:response regulator [Thiotrichales bacterium]HIP69121.1 response regulator [Chromatiales bacterium]
MTAQQVHYNAIRWVKKELDQTLSEARVELDALIETPDDMTHLQQLRNLFRQVQGVLEMVEIQGGVLLLEELRALLNVYAEGTLRNRDDALEVITRAIVQLPDYLDYIQRGNADVPIVLLPLLNDLRTSRDASLLSDRILTLPDIDQDQQALTDLPTVKEDLQTIAKALRPLLQLSLLGWFKNQSVDRNLLKIAAIFHRLVSASEKPESKRLWWISQAVTEALQCHALESSITIKALFGKIDRQLKVLISFGEEHFASQVPLELIKNLLFYVASANSGNSTVNAVKTVYRLNDMSGETGSLELARASMSGPNKDMYESISSALLEDVNEIKERLEVYTLANQPDNKNLESVVSQFARLGDTMSMLGLTRLRESMSNESHLLKLALKTDKPLPREQIQGIADALMDAEMEIRAYAAERKVPDQMPHVEDEGLVVLPDHEYEKVLSAVIHESLIVISHCKEAILAYVGEPGELHPVMQIPALLKELNGAMVMLPLASIVPVIEGLQSYIDAFINQQHTPGDDELNALADTIVSIEFYLESLQAGKGDHQIILDRGEQSLALLMEKLPASEDPLVFSSEIDLPELVASDEEELTPPESVLELKKNAEFVDSDIDEKPEEEEKAEDENDILADLKVLPEEVDEEILEIFKEEVSEEIERISETLPNWLDNPSDTEPLSIIRRSFHTLKGSGRLVGAQVLGEFAWTHEDLLNRVIENTLQPTTAITSALKSATELLPGLLEALHTAARPGPEVAKQMEKVEALIKGEDLKEPSNETLMVMASINAPDDQEEDALEEQEKAEEPVVEVDEKAELFDIFRAEAKEYLAIVDEFITRIRERNSPSEPDEELYRALHTLNGSARTADVEAIYAPCAAAEVYADACDQAGAAFSEDFPDLLETLTQHVRDVFKSLDHGDNVEKPQALIDRFTVLAEKSQQLMDAEEVVHEPVEEAAQEDEPEALGTSTNLVEVAVELGAELDAAIDQAEEESSDEKLSETVADDFDEELAEIFLEEAGELLDSSENAMSSWKDEPADLMPVKELQRHLHTLKGGARMAGIKPIGDLSHAMESLFLAVVENKVKASDDVFASLHDAFDQLHKMTHTAAAKEPVEAASSLVEKLENFIEGRVETEIDQASESSENDEPVDEEAHQDSAQIEDMPVVEEPLQEVEILEPEAEPVVEDKVAEIIPLTAPEPAPASKQNGSASSNQEMVRVRSDLLDELVNHAGEVNIFHSRVEEQVVGIGSDLQELEQTISRLARQLRSLEGEAEAQILSQLQRDEPIDFEGSLAGLDFDPLELDRYSKIQQLSRSLAESINDLTSIQNLLTDAVRDTETLLVQQSRISTGLQDGLMHTRMVPFTTMLPRLRRVVRQTAASLGKKVKFKISGESSELDRKLLDSMVVPLEHMLRNAIAHGIETPEARKDAGKPETGHLNVSVSREGNEVVVLVEDDGMGIPVDKIRARAQEKGLINESDNLTDKDIMQFILESGLSTADEISQVSGRGVGMDIVNTEIKQLNGQLSIDSRPGEGTSFRITLPFTLAINQALLVQSEDELYAVPMNAVEGVVRVSAEEVTAKINSGDPIIEHAEHRYELKQLASLLHQHEVHISDGQAVLPVLLLRAGDHRIALLVNEVLGNREVVIKSLGTLLSKLASISGATILGDGKVVLVLDIAGMIRASATSGVKLTPVSEKADEKRQQTIMVVDDSITIRKVTSRILERHNFHVVTAKDGVDAVSKLQETTPDLMLLDIEMPRMDGYELAGHVRNQKETQDLPIIMITSRTGKKHKDRAMSLGVNQYLGKPYQEGELMDNITALLAG